MRRSRQRPLQQSPQLLLENKLKESLTKINISSGEDAMAYVSESV
jgi:hypothetical protein